MTLTADRWRINVVRNTDRLVGVAMDYLGDANEARWLVHGVMLGAMTDMLGPEPQARLDQALRVALRDHAVNAA